MDKINDPIYGLIKINPIESEIINSTLFQRLRNIKQLGMTFYVYPTATHNRFSHSIGVMYLADKIFSSLEIKYNDEIKSFGSPILKNLRMAGLLHDIGHFPFSHSLEFTKEDQLSTKFPKYISKGHEKLTTFLIKNSYINDILQKDKEYDVKNICALIKGKSTDNLVINKLINWELDADRLDYLLRDSYFTGVRFGVIDYNYLIENLEIKNGSFPFLVINEKAARSIENILISRYSLYDRVYHHQVILYYDYILKNLVKQFFTDIIPDKILNQDLFKSVIKNPENVDFTNFTDQFVIHKLFEKYNALKSENKQNIIKDLESLLFRRKNDKIFHFPYVTKKKPIDLVGRYKKISEILSSLDKHFETDEAKIRLNKPMNNITSYSKNNYSIWDIDQATELEALKDKEKGSILIKSSNDNIESFFQWNGSYFKDIFDYNNFKTYIYLRKDETELIKQFKTEWYQKIENILKD